MTVSIELVNAMYGHSQWTNNQMLKTAENLSTEELNKLFPAPTDRCWTSWCT